MYRVESVSEIVHHVAFALAALALGAAALRVAGRVAPEGLERALVAVVLAVATAIVTALALGLVGLGTNPVVLTVAAVAMWAGARALVPGPAVAAPTELALWWGSLGAPLKLAVGALTGVFAAWLAWQLRFPSIGFDSAVYHYPDVAGWIANGRPGSQLELSYDIPYGNYPLTDEVGQTWGAAIARSYIPLALWNPAMLVVAGGATWLTLRNLRVSTAVTALATATLLSTPLLVRQLNEAQNDLPALAWLACCAAFATGAGRRPALLVPALLAAGLGIGTKATVAPAALAALAVGAYLARGRLRPLARWLALGLAGAFAVGGFWYVRNIVQHGSPLWPFVDLPWGSASPRFLGSVDQTFLGDPGAALEGRLGEYTALLGGSWLVLAGSVLVLLAGLLLPLREPGLRRGLVVSALLGIGMFVIWSVSWGSGMQTSPELATPAGWSISALRYLLPGIALAVLSVALATRLAGLPGRLATLLLVAALVWSIAADARFGTPWTPSLRLIAAGAVAGALLAAIAIALRRTQARRPEWLPAGAAAVAGAVVLGVAMTPVASGYIERSTKVVGSTQPAPELVSWFLERPGFDEEDYPVAIASRAVMSSFAGDRFQHPLELIPQEASCPSITELAKGRPLLVTRTEWFEGIIGVEPYSAPGCLDGTDPAYRTIDFNVLLPPG